MEIIDGLSNAAYHGRRDHLGSSSLKTLARPGGPAKWKWEQGHPRESTAFDVGTIAHSVILEGDSSSLVVVPVDNKRGKAWSEPAEAARADGKIPLTMNEAEAIYFMRDSVMAHPVAASLLTGHIPERSIFWDDTTGLGLKCRPDALRQDQIIDLKTCANADPSEFGRTAFNFGYHQQAAHYIDGVAMATGEVLPFKFVLVEKNAPHLVSVVELDEEAIDYGREMNARATAVYQECMTTGNWPGYPATEPISLPPWAFDYEELEEFTFSHGS